MSNHVGMLKIAFKHSPIFFLFILLTYLTSFHSYLLFHSLSEMFSIVIAFGMFAIAWNTRRFMQNNYMLLVGISFFFIALVDLVHMFAYEGMNVFNGSNANLATQLWIFGRYMQALSLVAAVFFINRKLYPHITFAVYGIATIMFFVSVFYFHIFPDAYVAGTGLTAFKIRSEYIVAVMQLLAAWFLYQKREYFEGPVLLMLVTAICLSVASGIFFTAYAYVYDRYNLVGHLVKMCSFYLFYIVIIRTALVNPYKMLFRKLDRQHKFKTAVMNTINAFVIALDRHGKIVMLNNACEKATGYSTDDVRDTYLWELLMPENAAELKSEFECLPDVARLKSGEKCWVTKDGQKIVVSLTNTVLRDHKGRPEFIITTGFDVTEKKQAEAEREHLIRELRDALANIKTLKGLIPICASCKKIRDDQGFWSMIEEYISEHSEVEFTHGICPECTEKYWKSVK
ncbi:MAG: PAS domain S-box protein [Nitrospiraceae bacterium]|nr:PAS domain S-box protein [Nitrospiraceae bacterium]